MRSNRSLNITLPAEMADLIEAKVASGVYPDESAVIQDGLRALVDLDGSFEKWLHAEVVPAYDDMTAHPERAIPVTQARDLLHAHIDDLIAQRNA